MKYCASCKRTMTRKVYPNGREEDHHGFLVRRYCDRECMGRGLRVSGARASNPTLWRRAAVVPLAAACEDCGQTERLSRHHVNEDKRDNRPSNIRTLCPSCHRKEHLRRQRLLAFYGGSGDRTGKP